MHVTVEAVQPVAEYVCPAAHWQIPPESLVAVPAQLHRFAVVETCPAAQVGAQFPLGPSDCPVGHLQVFVAVSKTFGETQAVVVVQPVSGAGCPF